MNTRSRGRAAGPRAGRPAPRPGASDPWAVVERIEVAPRWPLTLGGPGLDGIVRRVGGDRAHPNLMRLLHVGGEPVVVTVAQPSPDRLRFGARAATAALAREGIARMRFATGADDDLRPFYDRFRDDPLIGASVRAHPGLRVQRRPDPFEALAWAVCEQLIEFRRAAAIERSIVTRLGRRCARTGLRDLPPVAAVAGLPPARLEAMGLSAGRSVALIKAAREVAAGRVDLDPAGGDLEHGWRRLRAIRGIGAWTVEVLALHGQGRLDQLPAGDLAFLKLVGRLQTGNPRARASEDEVRAFFAPYAPWAGLAAAHALRGASLIAPGRAGTRSTAPARSAAA